MTLPDNYMKLREDKGNRERGQNTVPHPDQDNNYFSQVQPQLRSLFFSSLFSFFFLVFFHSLQEDCPHLIYH